jgi:hypothetical protein
MSTFATNSLWKVVDGPFRLADAGSPPGLPGLAG